jgi:hypothetical protein
MLPPGHFFSGKETWYPSVPIIQEAQCAPGPVWMGADNLAPPWSDPRTNQPLVTQYTDYAIPVYP